ncbi:MAG: hypothetical protein SVX43_02990 [Cyanobacteriota bacterium]|nr:hypothetical protein [Cyanobacteriota bacterium]
MKRTNKILSYFIGLGLLIGMASGATATQMEMPANQAERLRRIEQPLGLKISVTLSSLALIGAELWWFLMKKRSVPQATLQGNIQDNRYES